MMAAEIGVFKFAVNFFCIIIDTLFLHEFLLKMLSVYKTKAPLDHPQKKTTLKKASLIRFYIITKKTKSNEKKTTKKQNIKKTKNKNKASKQQPDKQTNKKVHTDTA